MSFFRPILVIALLATLVVPAAARANSHQISIMQDDRLLLNDATRDAALDRMQKLGVNEVRSLLIWRSVASGGYGPWDALVAGARQRGMSVLLTVTGPIPASASQCKTNRSLCKPSAAKFEKFVAATGRHFGRKVTHWSIWNEPNLNGWLLPQTARSGKTTYDYAARRYRDLFRAGAHGLAVSGHAKDQILLGETSPVGNKRAIPPVDFLRGVLCLDGKNRALTGAAARVRGCTGFKKLAATGLAHHPYTPAAACTPICGGGPHDITIASLGRLNPLLDAAARHGRIPRAAAQKLYLTEFGFQSNPPNKGGPVSLAQQALYLNESEGIAFRNPRVRSFDNYELDDAGAITFNTGLYFQSGKAKPSLAAWRVPLYVTKVRGGVRIFGGVRPGGAHTVAVQTAKPGGSFSTARTVHTNSAGYLSLTLKTSRTRFRLKSGTFTSRTARP